MGGWNLLYRYLNNLTSSINRILWFFFSAGQSVWKTPPILTPKRDELLKISKSTSTPRSAAVKQTWVCLGGNSQLMAADPDYKNKEGKDFSWDLQTTLQQWMKTFSLSHSELQEKIDFEATKQKDGTGLFRGFGVQTWNSGSLNQEMLHGICLKRTLQFFCGSFSYLGLILVSIAVENLL